MGVIFALYQSVLSAKQYLFLTTTKITELNSSAVSEQLALEGPSRQVAYFIYLRTVKLISSARDPFVFRTWFAPIDTLQRVWYKINKNMRRLI